MTSRLWQKVITSSLAWTFNITNTHLKSGVHNAHGHENVHVNRQQVHYHAMLLCCCHDLLGSRLHQYLLHYTFTMHICHQWQPCSLKWIRSVFSKCNNNNEILQRNFKEKGRLWQFYHPRSSLHDNHNTHPINNLSWRLLLHIIIGWHNNILNSHCY